MHAKHLALLSAFAGGCLSSAVLLGSLGDEGRSAPLEGANQDDPLPADRAAAESLPHVRAATAAEGDALPTVRSSRPADAAASEAPGPGESGRSIADVLARLEAAYQQTRAAVEPAAPVKPHAEAQAESSEPAPEEHAAVPASALAPPTTRTPAPSSPAPTQAPIAAAAAMPATPGVNPSVEAVDEPVLARAPRDGAALTLASREASPSPAALVNSGQEGAVAANPASVYQLQQLLLLQYFQVVVVPPLTSPPARARRRGAPIAQSPRAPFQATPWGGSTFPNTLPSPANPWGFQSQPPVLVR